MADRETLIAALGCTGNECENCPYHVVQSDEFGTWGWCDEEKLESDAIEILREQEPVKPRTDDAWPSPIHFCGHCGYSLPYMMDDEKPKYCCACGRAVKWDDDGEDALPG